MPPQRTDVRERTLSVALATYNGARYLVEQLDSINAQSELADEIVISDDGSTDDTVAIVEAYAPTSAVPIRLLPPGERLGFADNFLRAAAHCRSRFIAFCDQDDVWYPDKAKRCLDALLTDHSAIVLHRHTLVDADLNEIGILSQEIARDRVWEPLAFDPHLTGWGNSMTFDRTLLDLIPANRRPLQPENKSRLIAHDSWIYTLAAATGRVSHIYDCLCYYRQHGHNVFGSIDRTIKDRLKAAASDHTPRFRERYKFCYRMAALFRDAAARSTRPGPLLRAAEAYRLRAILYRMRARVYTRRWFTSRLRSLYTVIRLRREDEPSSNDALSITKDVVLGVCGLGLSYE